MKIGMSYLELRDKTKAGEALNRLIEDYPESKYKGKAGKLLRRI